jgi:hypothetical protein
LRRGALERVGEQTIPRKGGAKSRQIAGACAADGGPRELGNRAFLTRQIEAAFSGTDFPHFGKSLP